MKPLYLLVGAAVIFAGLFIVPSGIGLNVVGYTPSVGDVVFIPACQYSFCTDQTVRIQSCYTHYTYDVNDNIIGSQPRCSGTDVNTGVIVDFALSSVGSVVSYAGPAGSTLTTSSTVVQVSSTTMVVGSTTTVQSVTTAFTGSNTATSFTTTITSSPATTTTTISGWNGYTTSTSTVQITTTLTTSVKVVDVAGPVTGSIGGSTRSVSTGMLLSGGLIIVGLGITVLGVRKK